MAKAKPEFGPKITALKKMRILKCGICGSEVTTDSPTAICGGGLVRHDNGAVESLHTPTMMQEDARGQ